jgi:hypothetical protein
MELFSPDNLPGVGMGDLESIAAVCGLLGIAATSGVLIAEGILGTILYIVSALALLGQKDDFGRSPGAAAAVLAVIVVLLIGRIVLTRGADRDEALNRGAAKDAPETKAREASIRRRRGWVQQLTIISVAWAGAVVGFAWAEWNEVPFRLEDAEAWVGLVLGLVAAAVGGDAAWRFLRGAVSAGGSAAIVGTVICAVAYVLNVLSVYVPFVGAVVFALSLVLAVRLHRRADQKYQGLRILR